MTASGAINEEAALKKQTLPSSWSVFLASSNPESRSAAVGKTPSCVPSDICCVTASSSAGDTDSLRESVPAAIAAVTGGFRQSAASAQTLQ